MPVDPKRQAAALEALRTATPPRSEAASFWERHGGKIVLAVVIIAALWLATRAVGSFLRASVDETSRAQEELRRGMRR